MVLNRQKIFILCVPFGQFRGIRRRRARFLKRRPQKTREYVIPVADGRAFSSLRSFDGIMEIYVSGNCKFVLLGTIIGECIFLAQKHRLVYGYD